MDITWHGNTCATFKGKTATVVLNPDKTIKSPLKGKVVLSSLGEGVELAEVKEMVRMFDWPGEYEVAGIPIVGLNAWTRSRSKEEEGSEKDGRTIIFSFEVDGIKICHLGGLGHKLTSEMVDDIGDVDVLCVPTGDMGNLTGKTEEVIDQIDPRVVLLMGTGDAVADAKAAGAKLEEPTDKITIASRSTLPEDKTLYYSLAKV